MKFALIFTLFILTATGCAKLSYLTEQGIEQVKLQWGGKDNDSLLKDPKVSEEVKRKIMLIGEYKKYFYYYFSEKPSSIYSKTSILENKAVTYLVVASPHTKIEAHEFEFPFMGGFPYIGFFKLDSAKDFAKRLEEDENLVTWIRPVYAYSTLGYLEDRILSSFFEYDDIELAELIFHELFHTLFFITDEVDLNENLANLFGSALMQEHFKGRPELTRYLDDVKQKKEINQRVVDLIGILQMEFAKLGGFITDKKSDELTERFVNEVFKPDLRALCDKLSLAAEDCELKETWNQASFAAFLTYEENQDFLEQLRGEQNLNFKDFLSWLRMEHKKFKKQKKIESFTDYLKTKVKNAPTPTY